MTSRDARRAAVFAIVFAAGAVAGWIAARGSDATPAPPVRAADDDAPHDVSPAAVPSAAPRDTRPPRPRDDTRAPAFPELRWREPSQGPSPPPPGPDGDAPPDPAPIAVPAATEAQLAFLVAQSQRTSPLDDAMRDALRRTAEAVAGADPRPRIAMDLLRGIGARDVDAAAALLPCVAPDDAAAEIALLLAGSGAWGQETARDAWIARFAAIASRGDALPADLVDRMCASPRPAIRAAAALAAPNAGPADRVRLRILVECDADPDVRIAAFRRLVETTRQGEESDTLDVVRRLLRSGDRDGDVAIDTLPYLGPRAVPLAAELLEAGGLDHGQMRGVAASLLRAQRAETLLATAASGEFNDELFDEIEEIALERPERLPSFAALVAAMRVPQGSAAAESHFQRVSNLGLWEILTAAALSTREPTAVRTAALRGLRWSDAHRDEFLRVADLVLRDPSADVRRGAIDEVGEAFAEAGPERAAVLRAIAARDPSSAVRRSAAEAVRRSE